jgi:tRNA-2-methylthio-N6-dimethylallyladenosine synthase
MPLIHLPVQSGSTNILESMNRSHTLEEYLKIIQKLREKKLSIKFSSDFIIAYPGETTEDFKKTVLLMKKVQFINTYSFIFNARPGTPAAKMKKIDLKIA